MYKLPNTKSTTQTGAAIFAPIEVLATHLFTRLGVAPVKQEVCQ